VQSEERALLWQSLRERAETDQLNKTELPEADLSPDILIALLGIKELQGSYETKEQEYGNFD
jgi:hypothetical protein